LASDLPEAWAPAWGPAKGRPPRPAGGPRSGRRPFPSGLRFRWAGAGGPRPWCRGRPPPPGCR